MLWFTEIACINSCLEISRAPATSTEQPKINNLLSPRARTAVRSHTQRRPASLFLVELNRRYGSADSDIGEDEDEDFAHGVKDIDRGEGHASGGRLSHN